MAINLTDNIRVGQQLPVDSRYFNGLLPWDSLVAVTTGIPTALRFRGLTVNILGVEYWWADGILDEQLVIKTVDVTLNLQEVTDEGSTTTNSITAASFVKDGGFDFQFLKADGSVDNNTYLTSADLPSTLDLYATTSPDHVIAGYTALVRNIADSRYNTTAVDVLTPTITGTLASPTFCGAVISDSSILLGNPGVFNFSVIGKIRRSGGSTSSGADFFYGIYKRDLAGVETLIANSAPVVVPANGGIYVEYISIALWNNGIFLSTDRVVLKFYGVKTGGGTGSTYEFLFGGADPVRGTAAISSAIIPNLYLRDLADVEKVPALDNEVLYWNDTASLWEHSLVVDLTPDASATQKGLVSIGAQTFAGAKTFNTILSGTVTSGVAISGYSYTGVGISGGSVSGTGVVGISGSGLGGSFQTDGIGNIVNFRVGASVRASISNSGIVIGTGLRASDQVSNTIASFDTNQNVVSLNTTTYPSLTELTYVKDVLSPIQTQFSGKQPLADNLTSLAGLTYSDSAFVKMTAAGTFTLEGSPITLSAIGGSQNPNGATLATNGTLTLQPAGTLYGGVITAGIQTIAGVKTFSSSPKAPTPTIGTNDTTLATTAFVNASIPGSTAYNILIGSGTGMGNIDTQDTGTSGGNSYPQNGRNVMINNGATAITITANTLLTATDFIASYTKVGTANITFLFTGTGRVEITPNGLALSGSAGSTALLTKNGNIFYLLINNLI